MNKPVEIKIGGFGGQGVILAGMIIGKAASIYDNKYATLIQSFGPEARGSACSAQLIISPTKILYPYVTRPNILMVMSQEAFTKFSPELAEDGTLLIEEDLVNVTNLKQGVSLFSIPATRFAEELGRRLVLNIVMVGFFASITNLVPVEAFRKAVADSVPKGTESLNLQAFEKGYNYGLNLNKSANTTQCLQP
ncbi:MAG: 2-oxoacid:acceptor oxidoreductase family protein [Verrucomicrobiia bacterium]|jgi:2-oxoglutarate ferredoxin oxidoreductase subunit gamma